MAILRVRPETKHRDREDVRKTHGKFSTYHYEAGEEEIEYDLTHRVEWAPFVANGTLGNPLDPYQEYTMVKNYGTVPVLLYHNTISNFPNPAFSRVILPGHWIEVVDLDTNTQPRIWVDSALYSSPAECEVLQVGYQYWEEEEPEEFCDLWAVGHIMGDGVLTKHYPELGVWANVANPITDVDHWLADVAGVDDDYYWAVGYVLDQGTPAAGLFAFWNGAVWAEVDPETQPPLYGVWGFAADDFWAVGGPFGGDGEIWHWNDIAWTQNCVPEPEYGNTYYCVHGDTPTNVFAGGTNESIVVYGGAGWVVDWGNPESEITWYGTWTSPLATSWVCGGTAPWIGTPGPMGAIYQRVGVGNWVPNLIEIPEPPTLRAMWGFNDQDIWCVGDYQTILYWNGGPMWMQVPSPPELEEYEIHYRGVFGCWPWAVWAIGTDEFTGNNVIIFWNGAAWTVVHGPNLAEGDLLGLKGVWVT